VPKVLHYWFVPIVTEIPGSPEAIQPPGNTDQHRFAGNLTGPLSQMYRLAFKDPAKSQARFPRACPVHSEQLRNLIHPGMIELVIGIGLLRLVKWSGKTNFTGDLRPITSLFLNCQVASRLIIIIIR